MSVDRDRCVGLAGDRLFWLPHASGIHKIRRSAQLTSESVRKSLIHPALNSIFPLLNGY